MPITNNINAEELYNALVSGVCKVISRHEHLNKINVFPVPDGDTGTNMCFTLLPIIEDSSFEVTDSIDITVNFIADTALDSARGNSGTIIAQFFHGMRKALAGLELANINHFAHALKTGYKSAHDSLLKPEEGTIITVMRDVANTTNHWDVYKQYWAEPGVKNVMGKVINQGKGGLRELTDFLAMHNHTITHLSTKLTQHFVSDNPSKSDIIYIENAWKKSNGNLNQIHTAVIERAILSKEPKFQWPMTWLFQTLRLSGATFVHGWDDLNQDRNIFNRLMRVDKIFVELGQSFWSSRQPDGYSSNKTEWISGEMFERRIRFSEAIYKAGKPQYKANQIMDRIDAGAPTRKLVDGFRNEQEKFIALMCSPELMGLENV